MNTGHDGLHIGDRAPDLAVPDAGGHLLRLSSLWEKAPLALVFIRHYG
jgi:hypothetical protein